LCTDSVLGDVARLFARHFISATVRLFPYEAFDAAGTWAAGIKKGKLERRK
jgi:hypothetical protein